MYSIRYAHIFNKQIYCYSLLVSAVFIHFSSETKQQPKQIIIMKNKKEAKTANKQKIVESHSIKSEVHKTIKYMYSMYKCIGAQHSFYTLLN